MIRTTSHTVTAAITENCKDPELMVHAWRAMFGGHTVLYYVKAREQGHQADRRDYELMQRLTQWQALMDEDRAPGIKLNPKRPAARYLNV